MRERNPEVIPPQGVGLLDGFEWVTMDLNNEKHVRIFKTLFDCPGSFSDEISYIP